MKALLFDSPPWHWLPVAGFSEDHLVLWDASQKPRVDIEGFRGVDVALIHAGEGLPGMKLAKEAAVTACRAKCRVMLFTGDVTNGDAHKLATNLRDACSEELFAVVPLPVLQERLRCMLECGELSVLTHDRVANAVELLSALWMVGVLWQRDGTVTAVRGASGWVLERATSDEQVSERRSIVGDDRRLDLVFIAEILAPSGRTLDALVSSIYRTKDLPAVRIDDKLQTVTRPDEFNTALAALRDVWLEWARGAAAPNYTNLG